MESLGDKLKSVREGKAYTIEYVSRETNISGRYLEALEKEDFSIFPGEPYVVGFLKTYGTYLELDAEEVLSLYRSHKIEEQPVPVEELLRTPSPLPKILAVVFVVIAAGALAFGAFRFITWFSNRPDTETEAARVPVEYSMNEKSLERRFYTGDTILIPLGANSYKLELSGLGDVVNITTPEGVKALDLGQEALIDLDSSGLPDLRITLADFAKNDGDSGALLRIELEEYAGVSPAVSASADPSASVISSAETGSGPAASREVPVIFNSPSAYPFTLQAAFQGYCLFRWEIIAEPDRRGRNEQYFQRSDERSIQAQNGIRIGVSNAQAVKLQIIGGGRTVPLELGGAGEIVAADIRWVRDEENRFRLVVLRLE